MIQAGFFISGELKNPMGKFRFLVVAVLLSFTALGQDLEIPKTQPSNFLSKTYYNANFGAIFYPFSNDNLPQGYATDTYSKNYFSGRFLLGYKLNPNLGIQFGPMRAAAWFKYDNVNNIGYDRSVWVNIWSLSLKQNINLSDKWSVFGEFGAANQTRLGFKINDVTIYDNAHFINLIYGFGLNYHINEKWKLSLNTTFLPESQKRNQPSVSQVAVGFEYHINKLDEVKAKQLADNSYFFPNNIIQFSYGTSRIGFGVNRFFGMSLQVGNFESFGIPIFWVGDVKAANTFSVTYERLALRTEKTFSLYWGASVTAFNTVNSNDYIFTFSIFPTLRFYLSRRADYDLYASYSIIGPTFITKSNIDNLGTGPNSIFQDKMGIGMFFGEKRKYNFELRIMHYSNGNIFNDNYGVAIPIQFTLGKTF